jgi:hypothetical protein
MIEVTPLTDSTELLGNPEALRQRWDEDGTLYFRGIVPCELMRWAEQNYREALAAEGLMAGDDRLATVLRRNRY